MKDLVELLPDIITYVVIGYIFCYIYTRVAFMTPVKDKNTSLLTSFVIGYLYCTLIHIFLDFNDLFEILSSIIVAYITARILNTDLIKTVKRKIGFVETGNEYFWDDITDWEYPSMMTMSINKTIISGMGWQQESYSNDPHMILAAYKIYDDNGNMLKDYSNDKTKVIVVDCSKCDWIENIYYNESPMCNKMERLVESRKYFN